MKPFNSLLFCFVLIYSCNKPMEKAQQIELWKQEIIETERQFSEMAQTKGMNAAFLHFVANNGVLMRDNALIKGRPKIAEYLKDANTKGLAWTPDFVDVAASGDLAYTYGTYTYTTQDENGETKTSKGIFHTVWKRQDNGAWKFVWD